MFKLTNQICTLSSLNTRTEFHGDELKKAADINFKCTMANSVLDMFDDELRDFLFKKRAPDQEDLADKGMDEEYLSEMRFPLLQKKQAWGWEGAGYRLVIARGISGHEDINLINVELKKFKFEAKQGGSVDVEFQAKGHPSGEDVGSLFEELGEDVDLTLEPPSAEKLAQMELDSQREEEYDEEKVA